LADTLKKEINIDSELIKGGNGNFIVTVDGTVIFSKKSVGRFPEDQEILDAIGKTA